MGDQTQGIPSAQASELPQKFLIGMNRVKKEAWVTGKDVLTDEAALEQGLLHEQRGRGRR